ncbi:hypothetical protein EGW08_008860 [Elysia chlorotica]|uniref:Fucosyltransferase n=1 Tax=Elysia chlorotica TaxID=188477 RepID=A0A433TP67_ELYCH|nr:hypothetical protein EGW08_008860 [Elysia chlorotica]
MATHDAKYIRLQPTMSNKSGSLNGVLLPACSRHRSLVKACAVLVFFLSFSFLVYASRVYLFSQQDERTPLALPSSSSGSGSSHGGGDVGYPVLTSDELETEEGKRDRETSAEKTAAVLQRLTNSQTKAEEHELPLDEEVIDPDSDISDDSTGESDGQLQERTAEKDLVKKFHFFNPRPSARDWADFDKCDSDWPCAMASTEAEADVLLFNAARMRYVESLPKRRPNQIWVMYSREPPDLRSMDALDRRDLDNQVNYSRLVYNDSTWQVRYAILEEMATLPKKNYDNIIRGKRHDVAWFVSNCDRPSRRMEYVRRMMSTVDVHIYGKCGNWTCGDSGYNMGGQKDECLEKLSREYRFYLSFENTLCRDYVSEKFFNIFEGVDVVPVVRGGADYKRLFPSGIFINAGDFPSPESLGTYLHRLGRDEEAYRKILLKKSRYKKGRNKTNHFCDLCKRAHTGQPHHVYENFYKWVRAPGNCWKPTDLDPA